MSCFKAYKTLHHLKDIFACSLPTPIYLTVISIPDFIVEYNMAYNLLSCSFMVDKHL